MVNKEKKFYIAILIVVVAYLIASNYLNVDTFSMRITTVTALISAVAFWLQFKRTERLNESNFIMNLNDQFIGNKDMTQVEHELELFYNQYEAEFSRKAAVSADEVSRIHLGLNMSRVSPECQKMINYLVYLESLAALVYRQVIHLDVIDDLFSYRFFLAVNNPVVQECELLPYADFYQGIFRLSEEWSKRHRAAGIPIPMESFCLTNRMLEAYQQEKPSLRLDISEAMGDDKKTEIAGCIYDADRYIYPEAFGEDRELASKAIKRLIGMDGNLFDYKNLLVARYNGQVCGVCLVYDGSSTWDAEAVKKRIGTDLLPERIEEGFHHASKEYFEKHTPETIGPNTVELVACGVDEGFRRKRVARHMLETLIEMHQGKTIVLDVLASNQEAIHLYESVGFVKQGKEFAGFAPEGLKAPMCWRMVRKALSK